MTRPLAVAAVVAGLALAGGGLALERACRTSAQANRQWAETVALANEPQWLYLGEGRAVARTSHQIYLHRQGSQQVALDTPHFILGMASVRPPGQGPRLLVLTAERYEGIRFYRSHLLLLDPDRPEALRTLSPEPMYNFWDLSVGDVDGDGVAEVGLCTWSRTVLNPQVANRFFVYGWTADGDLYPRWRGSRLCRPYVWARLMDVAGDDRAELVSIETGLGGGQMLVAYEWNQFGFWGLGDSAEYPNLQVLTPRRCRNGDKVVWAVCHEPPLQPRDRVFVLQGSRWQAYRGLAELISQSAPCPFLPPETFGEHTYVSGAPAGAGWNRPLPDGQ